MTADDTANLRGIKGWLALLALYQIITVIKVTVTYVQSFALYLAPLDQPGPHLLDYAQLGVRSLIIPLVYATLITLFAKRKSFKTCLLLQWLGNPGIIVLDMIIIAAAADTTSMDMLGQLPRADIIMLVESFIVTGILVAYARTSRRVANTMVN